MIIRTARHKTAARKIIHCWIYLFFLPHNSTYH